MLAVPFLGPELRHRGVLPIRRPLAGFRGFGDLEGAISSRSTAFQPDLGHHRPPGVPDPTNGAPAAQFLQPSRLSELRLGYVVFGFATVHVDILEAFLRASQGSSEVRVTVQGFRESPDVVARLVEQTVQNLTRTFQELGDSGLSDGDAGPRKQGV